jgi:hypothetical protein
MKRRRKLLFFHANHGGLTMRVIQRGPASLGGGRVAGLRAQSAEEGLRASGDPVKDEDLARVSPLLRAHVIPNESYDLSIR